MIIVGLGNPGTKYKNTFHNIGFETIDKLAQENNFPEFKLSKKFKALVSEKNNTILAKPQTYMNNSGQSVSSLTRFYKTKELIIIHDDIDLPLGKTRISKNKGSAGHKGAESIIKELGSQDFTRTRIGICPKQKPKNVEKYVLKKIRKEIKKTMVEKAIKEIKDYLK